MDRVNSKILLGIGFFVVDMNLTNDFKMRIALIPGSFNPFTLGHKSLVDRALPLFDRVVIAVGVNSDKHDQSNIAARIADIEALYAHEPRVKVISYGGLTVEACREEGARWMVRGVRTVADFEAERALADMNRNISGVETVIFYTLPEYGSISSTVVRELERYGHDVSQFLPHDDGD